MNKKITSIIMAVAVAVLFSACGTDTTSTSTDSGYKHVAGQSAVQDDMSQPNVVQVAVGSKDHTTLVKAVQAAGLVDALSNAGPFTVFAPTNAAFDKLPKGTVESLIKPENKSALSDILQYHVSVGVYRAGEFWDGQQIGQANGGRISISVSEDGTTTVNGANIIASVQTSNGIIHVVDEVLLPPSKN